jgi:uncharacterized repeat protein (TIGR03803 family)
MYSHGEISESAMKVIGLVVAFACCLCGLALGQSTETVLYSFNAYPTDGTYPSGGLLFDSTGNIYGVTEGGGQNCQSDGGCGTVYELSPSVGGGWTETILYNFCSQGPQCSDGSIPYAGLIMDKAGNLYGTTSSGGSADFGTVYRLSPPSSGNGSWTKTVLWSFSRAPDNGFNPEYGKLNMDAAGNLYGTTTKGGATGHGIVFELSPQPGGSYSFSILHSFSGEDGALPQYGVAIDTDGNLYGTTVFGGIGRSICKVGCGVVFELSPSGGTWQETVLYQFNGVVGQYPISPISIDQFGDLYGTFQLGGGGSCILGSCGGVFELVPGTGNHGKEYTFYFNGTEDQTDGNPASGVLVGSNHTVYGTVGYIAGGNAYQLHYGQETILYNFCSLPNCADGSGPSFGTIIEHDGLLYGNTLQGGAHGLGVVYSLTK